MLETAAAEEEEVLFVEHTRDDVIRTCLTTYYLPLTAYYLLPTTCYLLVTTYY